MSTFETNAVTLSPATILIVDDSAINLASLGGFLQAHFKVLAAPSGERALSIATEPHKPDLILLDVMMPGMNGYDVLTTLRKNASSRHIPVIFMEQVNANQQ